MILIGGALLVTVIGYRHALTGLAYEFHALFIVPVLTVSWFLGPRFGHALARNLMRLRVAHQPILI
ncbi:MAG: hypothetical protein Q8M11_20490 [Sulfuritalea sp.]|nr:hypothetical protein [Sulfuritalea sp.]MDP1983776.1 hypothetical protein [Sulfuritalea sp.]